MARDGVLGLGELRISLYASASGGWRPGTSFSLKKSLLSVPRLNLR